MKSNMDIRSTSQYNYTYIYICIYNYTYIHIYIYIYISSASLNEDNHSNHSISFLMHALESFEACNKLSINFYFFLFNAHALKQISELENCH